MSTMGDVQYLWGYHDTCGEYYERHGGVQCHGGTQITKDDIPMVLNIPTLLRISPHLL